VIWKGAVPKVPDFSVPEGVDSMWLGLPLNVPFNKKQVSFSLFLVWDYAGDLRLLGCPSY